MGEVVVLPVERRVRAGLRHGVPLPALADRRTRVRLLAWSLSDAETGSDDGGRGSRPGSRVPGRNLELWLGGSYAQLDAVLDELRARRGCRSLYVRFRKAYVLPGAFVAARGSELARLREERRSVWAVTFVERRMPASIFVPEVVSEAAGYLPSEARRWARRRAG